MRLSVAHSFQGLESVSRGVSLNRPVLSDVLVVDGADSLDHRQVLFERDLAESAPVHVGFVHALHLVDEDVEEVLHPVDFPSVELL